ncbi:MAG: helix-turn-helix domain-containing protein [Coriobacteriales bacterium]
MQTTMAMLYDGLAKKAACDKCAYYDKDMWISHVALVGQCEARSPHGLVLIVSAGDTEGLARANALVGPSRIVIVGDSERDCAIRIPRPIPADAVLVFAEEALGVYRNWGHDLSEMVFQDQSVEALLEKAHDLFRNPLIVLDRALRVKARTAHDVMHDDMWTPLDHHGEMFEGPAEAPGFADFLDTLNRNRVVSDYHMFNGIRIASCRTREIGDDFLFVCLIQKKRPITDGDVEALKYLSEMVGILVKTKVGYENEDIGLNGLLIDGFKGRLVNPVELANRLRAVGLRLRERMLVIRIVSERGRLNDRQAHRFIDEIEHNFPLGHGFFYEEGLVFFSTFDEGKGMNGADYRKLKTFLVGRGLVAGAGEESSSDVPLREAYQKALYALSIGRKVFPGSHLLFFEDCREYYLYEVCAEEGGDEFFVHPAVGVTASVGGKAKTPLSEVLRRLSFNRGNRTKTAQELFIQRNTLQARIREIEELCSIDLSDPQTVSHIRQSYELLDYLSATEVSHKPSQTGGRR